MSAHRPLPILLLNPPGRRRFLRDYYCSTVSKAGYLWHPIDLLIQSGYLGRLGPLSFVDAIAENLSPRQTMERIRRIHPAVTFALVGAQSLQADLTFLRGVAGASDTRIVVSGEPAITAHEELLSAAPWINGVVQNFATPELEAWIRGGAPPRPQVVLGARGFSRSPAAPGDGGAPAPALSFPVPRHSLFLSRRYRIPLAANGLFASVLSTFGCPFSCSYCNSGVNGIGFAVRDLEHLFDEIRGLGRLPGVRHLFFRDMNFTTPRRRAMEICEFLLRENCSFSWNCYSRPDTLDEELCRTMARAGCRLIQIGIETFNEGILSANQRRMRTERIPEAFRLIRQSGMRSGAHFVLGLPGETFESMTATVDQAIKLNPDYVSFNLLQHRYGSVLGPGGGQPEVDPSRLARLKRAALLRYYLRPGYALSMLGRIRSPAEILSLIESGIGLAWATLTGETSHEGSTRDGPRRPGD